MCTHRHTNAHYWMQCVHFSMSLQFYHHPAVDDITNCAPRIFNRCARQTYPEAAVVPPTSTAWWSTVGTIVIVVLVVGRELHAVVVESTAVTFVLEAVAGVSAVSGHFQSIFIVELITNLERPVLGWVPEGCYISLHLDPQSVRLRTGEKVKFLKTDPEVGINGSKPSFVLSPIGIPARREGVTLMKDDPTEHRLDRYRIWPTWQVQDLTASVWLCQRWGSLQRNLRKCSFRLFLYREWVKLNIQAQLMHISCPDNFAKVNLTP